MPKTLYVFLQKFAYAILCLGENMQKYANNFVNYDA